MLRKPRRPRQTTEQQAQMLLARMALDELRMTHKLVSAELARRETHQPIQAWGGLFGG